MKHARHLLVLLVIAALALGGWSALAHGDGEHAELPQVTIEKSADGYVLPADIPEGAVAVTINNQSDTAANAMLARLNPDVTLDAFMEALGQGPIAALPLVSLVGGTEAPAGESKDVILSFKPGTYVLLDMGEDAPPPVNFTVADGEGEGAAAPEGDVKVSLLDFAFSLPLEMSAGEQLWQVENKGTQWHEMGIVRIDPNTPMSELHEIINQMNSEEELNPDAESAVQPVNFMFPISAGERTWFNLDLEPGSYMIICFLPDLENGHAHFEEGMMQVVTVK